MTDDRRVRFEALYIAHLEAVRRYAARRAGSREAAEEVVADTFLVCWRRLDDVPSEPLPWLYGVARRTLANQRRTMSRVEATVERTRWERSSSAVGRDAADLLSEGESIRRALRSLSATEREAIALVAWEGLEGAAAARAAGCSRIAFAMRLHRARRRIAAVLSDELGAATEPRPVEGSP